MFLKTFRVLTLLVFVFGSIPAVAQTILTLTNPALNLKLSFSLQDLLDLEQWELETSNEFIDGKRSFRGPLARDVIEKIGGDTTSRLVLTAANDYQVELSSAEFYTYNVILALNMDDRLLSRRDKGPIWLIYPMSDFEELRDPVYNSRLIWQLVQMDIH